MISLISTAIHSRPDGPYKISKKTHNVLKDQLQHAPRPHSVQDLKYLNSTVQIFKVNSTKASVQISVRNKTPPPSKLPKNDNQGEGVSSKSTQILPNHPFPSQQGSEKRKHIRRVVVASLKCGIHADLDKLVADAAEIPFGVMFRNS